MPKLAKPPRLTQYRKTETYFFLLILTKTLIKDQFANPDYY